MAWARYDQALWAGLCGLICSFSSGMSGFGGTIIFQMVWAFLDVIGVSEAGDVRTATAALAFQELVAGAFNLFRNRKDSPRWDIWWGIYPALSGMLGLGHFVLMEVDGSELKLVLGLTFYSVAAFKIGHMTYEVNHKLQIRRTGSRKRRDEMQVEAVELHNFAGSDDDSVSDTDLETEAEALHTYAPENVEFWTDPQEASDRRRDKCCSGPLACWYFTSAYFVEHRAYIVSGFLTALAGGFLGGLFGTGGPPFMIYFGLLKDISKSELRTTAGLIDLTVFPWRLLFGILMGVMTEEEWFVYLLTACGSLIGMMLGDFLHNRLNLQVVLLSLVFLVLASSAMLAEPGNGTTFGWIVLPLFIFMPLLLLYLLWLHWKLSTYTSKSST